MSQFSKTVKNSTALTPQSRKKFPTKGHEARLYSSMIAGLLFPISIFIYAGCSASNVHWIGMCIAIVVSRFNYPRKKLF